ncbi:MAG: Smr/MutS family protein [Thiotrichales bacterium]|nr:Smr/MutS family protein [Thiotrichales bacterium]
MSKRGRISDEDRALFRQAAGEVRRMEDDRAYPRRPRSTSHLRDRTPVVWPTDSRGLAESEWTPDVGPGDVLSFTGAGVQRRETERLRRGRYRVEADLDLHGRTVADASAALDRFLEDSRRHGRRCVRIVHGKGLGSPSGQPIMKAHIDRWLRNRSEVLAFCSATPPDGGTGALYVLLRR